IMFSFGLTGHSAMMHAMISYGIKFHPYSDSLYSDDYKALYIKNLNIKYDCLNMLYFTENDFIKSIKYLHLLPDIDVLILTRDPISKLKSGLNHGWAKRKDCYVDSEMSIEQILDGVDYAFTTEDVEACYLTMEYMLNKWLDNHIWRYNAITNCLVSDNILYLDMEDIMPDKIIDTFETLRKRFDFKETPNADIQCTAFGDWRYIIPLTVNFKPYDIAIHIDPKQHLNCDNVDLNIIFDKKHKLLNDVSFSVSRLDYEKICKNDFIIKELSSFEDIFLEELNKKIIDIKNKKYTEMDILRYIKEDSDIRTKMLNLFTEEFIHIKQHRPDIVASWKYYQEFEKMCEELDGKEDSLKENISNN
ncbi:DUF2972 domain-containing protein, partial [Campylobacter insulaenigrae]|uniref:DUF2972 domain-containing protein n=1 Tax=Campylobacter insulaenigrae TaxID=260714 RepID=UPI0021532F65